MLLVDYLETFILYIRSWTKTPQLSNNVSGMDRRAHTISKDDHEGSSYFARNPPLCSWREWRFVWISIPFIFPRVLFSFPRTAQAQAKQVLAFLPSPLSNERNKWHPTTVRLSSLLYSVSIAFTEPCPPLKKTTTNKQQHKMSQFTQSQYSPHNTIPYHRHTPYLSERHTHHTGIHVFSLLTNCPIISLLERAKIIVTV